MAVRSVVTGQKELSEFLKEFPDKVQRRVARHAVKKAGQALAVRAKTITPWNKKKSKKEQQHRPWNAKDWYISVSRNKQSLAKQIVGIQSYKAPHKHLFEFGTQPRWINMATKRKKSVPTGKFYMKSKRVQRADGSWRYEKQMVEYKSRNVSEGSVPIKGKFDMSREGRKRQYRGRMPVFLPLTKAFQQMTPIMLRIIEDETRKGLNRALMRAGADIAS